MKTKITLLLAVFFALSVNSFAQIDELERVEIDQKDVWSADDTYTFGRRGVIVISSRSRMLNRGMNEYEAMAFDSVLSDERTVEFELPRKTQTEVVHYQNEGVFILAYDYKSGIYKIVGLDPELNKTEYEGKTLSRVRLDNFSVMENQFLITVFSKRKRSTYIYSIDRESGDMSLLATLKRTKDKLQYSLLEVQVLSNRKEAYFTFNMCSSRRCHRQTILHLSSEGVEGPAPLETGEVFLHATKFTKMENGDVLLAGTYQILPGSGIANGIVYGKMDELGTFEFFNHVNFTDLDKFFDYLPERQQNKIARKKGRKSKRGKELNLNYRMVMHDMKWVGDHYVLVGEAYYATYRQEPVQTYNASTGTYTTTYRTVFDGYQYTHAMLIGIDTDGEMRYENIMEMSVYPKPYSAREYVNIIPGEGEVRLLYQRSRDIAYTVFDDGIQIQDKVYKGLKGAYENDKVKISALDVVLWYDNILLSYGFQNIKNTRDEDVKRRRSVYVLQKARIDW